MQPTSAELSEDFSKWQLETELDLQSEVYRVNKKGDNSVPCGAPVLVKIVLDTRSPILTNWGLDVRYSITHAIYFPILQFLKICVWIVLKAFEKSKNKILTDAPADSKWL